MENIDNSHKEIFRIDDDKNINETFQTVQMKEKIKNIKKRKKKKVNFKNIEEFEVLENINEDEEDNEEDEEHKKIEIEDDKPITISKLVYDFYGAINNFFSGNSVKEGVRFKRDDYEGYDNVKEGARSNFDPRQMLIEFIERVYDRTNRLNNFLAGYILNALTEGKHNASDHAVTRENIVWLLCVLAATWGVFNWYFILFYARAEGIPIFRFSRLQLFKMGANNQDDDASDSGPILAKFAYWVGEFAVAFFEFFNDFFILTLPRIFAFFFDGRVNFLAVFIGLIFAFKNYASSYKKFLLDLLGNATDNSIINAMYGILIVLYVVSMASLPLTGNIPLDIQTTIDYFGAFMSPIMMIIKMIIRFMVIMVVSVPLGGLFIGAIFAYYSFFGIYHYQGVGKMKGTINGIINHVKYKNSLYNKTKYCRSDPFYRFILLILSILKLIAQALYLFKTPIALLVALIFGGMTSYNKLSDVSTMLGNQPLNISMAAIFFMFAFVALISIFTNIFLSKEFLVLIEALKTEIPNIYKEPDLDETKMDYDLPDIYEEYLLKQTKATNIMESIQEIINIEKEEKNKATSSNKEDK
tara:strand:- start:18 stop:1766 length:1749 start_codon:yes stop_codon:yes gene_type:complete